MRDKNVINLDYNPNQEPPNIVDTLKRMYRVMLENIKREEEMMKNPDWEYHRIHIVSREIAEMMLSPDTPVETKRQLERATFAGYRWIKKSDTNVFIDEVIDG